MPDRIDYDIMVRMLSAVVRRIREAKDTLSTLDAATGDGDHGTAMCKIAYAIAQHLDGNSNDDLQSLLSTIGWSIMGTDSGSAGPLYGSWFLGLSESCANSDDFDTTGFAVMIEHSLSNLRNYTNAQPGGKTMIDALCPAIDAVRKAADEQKSLEDTLISAANAAENGAQQTKNMQASFGRAKNIGERSIGHVDPGAASMSIIFSGLKEGFIDG